MRREHFGMGKKKRKKNQEARRQSAAERTMAYGELNLAERLGLLEGRRGASAKERARLERVAALVRAEETQRDLVA
jgi:hypothetical protein